MTAPRVARGPRPFLAPIWMAALAALLLAVVGVLGMRGVLGRLAQPTTIILLRHAEKAPEQSALPEELRGLSKDDYHIFRADKEFLINNPEWVDDPLASGGKALRLADNWSTVQWRVRSYFAGRWRCYVRARCVMKDPAQIGPSGYLKPDQAFETGVFDAFLYPNGRYYLARENVAVEKVKDGAYHTYDLGVHDLKPGMHIWATIADSPAVKEVYVDRVFLVREKQQ